MELISPIKERALVDMWGVDKGILSSTQQMDDKTGRIVADLGLTIVQGPITHPFHPIGQAGITTVYVIGESHFIINTWPEQEHANFEIATCSPQPILHPLPRLLLVEFNPNIMLVTFHDYSSGTALPNVVLKYDRRQTDEYVFTEYTLNTSSKRKRSGLYSPGSNRFSCVAVPNPF